MKTSNTKRVRGVKYIKVKKKVFFVGELQDLILDCTNAGLISIGIHRACRKFEKELTNIPLSDEFQSYSLPHKKQKK